MTKKELSKLYFLKREIESDEERLIELRTEAASPSTSVLSDLPSGSRGNESRTERLVSEIIDLEQLISAKQNTFVSLRRYMRDYFNEIEDVRTRTILQLRFDSFMSWKTVAQKIGGNETPASVRQLCSRYLRM